MFGFIVAFISFMGLFFLLGAYDNLSAPLEAVTFAALGIGILWFATRLATYFFKPAISITDKTFVARRILKPGARWEFGDLKRFETSITRIEKGHSGRRLPTPLFVERLHAVALNDTRQTVTLPAFAGSNETLISELKNRSLLEVKRDFDAKPEAPLWRRLFGKKS
ncbi:hypothetical protein [Sulfitobacter aestuariivivens]|uniref:hypothetical protein n=1 Tax=Sulfitobacter aestuariivivens TaxID=2766981 RepID=UPI001C20ED4A|nr:hypothetical protein [Sulfitobacter aestuariivivens]